VSKRVLGRGLDALISQDLRESVTETERIKELDINRIDPNPFQPRTAFDEGKIDELAASIGRHGVLQPIVVRRSGERYELIVGERRLRATKKAGIHTIPAIVRDVTDDNSLKYALLENLQREDLNPVEEARGLNSLREEYGLSAKDIAEILGKDRSTVANTLRLLKLPERVLSLIEEGRLSAGHARAILSIEGARQQVEWAERVVNEGITVRELERATPGAKQRRRRASRGKSDPQLRAVEERLERHLGTRVRLAQRRKGGVIAIEYYSEEDLERVLEKIGIDTVF
jgi:ParB family chromosome partitioning protein